MGGDRLELNVGSGGGGVSETVVYCISVLLGRVWRLRPWASCESES
jgi:hypothetical protein